MAERELTIRIAVDGLPAARRVFGELENELAGLGSRSVDAIEELTTGLVSVATAGGQLTTSLQQARSTTEVVAAGVTALASKAGETTSATEQAIARTIERSTSEVVKVGTQAFDKLFQTGRIEAFGDAMVKILRRALAQVAAELVIRPIIQPIIGDAVRGAPGLFAVGNGTGSVIGSPVGGLSDLSGLFSLSNNPLAKLGSNVSGLFGGATLASAPLYGSAVVAQDLAATVGISAGQAALLANSAGSAFAAQTLASTAGISAGQAALATNAAAAAAAEAPAAALSPLAATGIGAGVLAAAIILPQILGGLFGKKPTSGPNAGATIGVDDGRLSVIASGADNNGKVETALNLAEGAIKGLDRVLRNLGASISAFTVGPDYPDTAADDRGLEVGYHKGKYFVKAHDEDFTAENNSYEKPEDAVAAFIVRALKGADLAGVSAEIATALAHTSATDLQSLLADIDFARGFRQQIELMTAGLDPATAQLGQLNSAADKLGKDTLSGINDFIDKTTELGLGTKDEVLPALRGMVEGLLGLKGTETPLSGVALALKTFELNARALQPALEAVGLTAEDATKTIATAVQRNERRTAEGLLDTLHAQANPFLGAFQSAAGVHAANYGDLLDLFGRGVLSDSELGAGAGDANAVLAAAATQAFNPIKDNIAALTTVFETFKDDGSAAGQYIAQAAAVWKAAAEAAAGVGEGVAQLTAEGQRLLDQLGLRELKLAGNDRGALVLQNEQQRASELAAAEAAGFTAEQLQRLAAVLDGEAATALGDFDAAVARTAADAAKAAADFGANLDLRSLKLAGDDRGVLIAEHQSRAEAEIAAAEAAGRTSDQIQRLTAILNGELSQSLAEFDARATDAAAGVGELAAKLNQAFAGIRGTLAQTVIGATGAQPLAGIFDVIAPDLADQLLSPFADFLSAAQKGGGYLDELKAAAEAVLALQGTGEIDPEQVDNINRLLQEILSIGSQAAQKLEQDALAAARARDEEAAAASRAAEEQARLAEENANRRIAIEKDFGVRVLDAQGKTREAQLVRFQAEAERQRAEYAAVGGNIAQLNAVLSAELDALNQTLAAETAKLNQDVEVRFLRATGHELEARLAEFDASAAAQRQEAERVGADLARLNQVLDLERQGVIDDWEGVADAAARAAQQAADAFRRAYEQLRGVVADLPFGATSPLTPAQRLAEAQSAFGAAVEGARARDVGAIERLGDVTRQLLEEGRSFYASGSQYGTLFQLTRSTVEQVLAQLGPAYQSLLAGVPGFAEGGRPPLGRLVMVGERGPELVRFLSPAQVYPSGTAPGEASGATSSADWRQEMGELKAELASLNQQVAALIRITAAGGDLTLEKLTSIDTRQGEVVRLTRQRSASL